MEKPALAIALTSMLLVSALAGTLLINAGIANPTNLGTTVMLLSPENKTYAQNTISIAFTYSEQVKSNPYYKYILDENESGTLTCRL